MTYCSNKGCLIDECEIYHLEITTSCGEFGEDELRQVQRLIAEVRRLRLKAGETDLSWLIEDVFWGDGWTDFGIDNATPDTGFRAVLRTLAARMYEPVDMEAVAEETGLAPEAVRHYLERLRQAGVLGEPEVAE